VARAIWKGVIVLDGIKLPVKLYSAVEDRNVHFRLLHQRDKEPVTQVMVNPESGDEVSRERIRKGAEVEPGVFVLLDESELQELEPEPNREIKITRFVDETEINHQWYERPYYLGPDGDNLQPYWNLVSALEDQKKEGVARWVMRKRWYVGSLRVETGYLMLITLRFSREVISAHDLQPPRGRELEKKEVNMARQLVQVMVDEFNPEEFRDEFRSRVMELVEAKAKGRKPKPGKVERKQRQRSLTGALEASIAAARKRKHG
jgi:DNA end-binding protein Ku